MKRNKDRHDNHSNRQMVTTVKILTAVDFIWARLKMI